MLLTDCFFIKNCEKMGKCLKKVLTNGGEMCDFERTCFTEITAIHQKSAYRCLYADGCVAADIKGSRICRVGKNGKMPDEQ